MWTDLDGCDALSRVSSAAGLCSGGMKFFSWEEMKFVKKSSDKLMLMNSEEKSVTVEYTA